ncbi:MAG: hypothetical protein J7639_27160 [Paenibacillaceae bacterium]|nr:hypothetical protein [Paenibacillaceae bacterium]
MAIERKNLLIISIILVAIVIISLMLMNKKEYKEVSLDGNYIKYQTLNDLENGAQLIILAEPLKSFNDRTHKTTYYADGAIQDFYTLTDVKIHKIYKKPNELNLDSKQLSIVEPVGIMKRNSGNFKLLSNHFVELNQGNKYILFLAKNSFGQYSIINSNEGKYNIDGKDQKDDGEHASDKLKIKKDLLAKYEVE